VSAQLARGTAFAMPTREEIELAELLVSRIASVDQVRFTNSGSESVMMAIKAARAFTGRPKVISFEGSYHGSYDAAEASLPPHSNALEAPPQPFEYSVGPPRGVLDNTIVLPFNDSAAFEAAFAANRDSIAAVLIDPMPLRIGMIRANQDFIELIRERTAAAGVVLIFDEVVNLRVAYGGIQSLYGVEPDLTTMAKIIGGGFAGGAVGGSETVMSVFDPTLGHLKAPHGGTFNANPVTMTAGKVAMEKLTPEEFARLDRLGESIRAGIGETLARHGVDGQVTGAGSLFYIHLHDRPLTDYRSSITNKAEQAFATRLHRAMMANGVFMSTSICGCLSTPMGEGDIDAFTTALGLAIEEARA
ncbi:MAG: aminotransferase class III-fold pyridoxal phosphate-dependent enzyme, partial [Thermomicrobiales bacterium]|nr:aminotransferase class III-fold pyridoxal phosphate-dependent enzyme [Thermomicrobiales bacterium]